MRSRYGGEPGRNEASMMKGNSLCRNWDHERAQGRRVRQLGRLRPCRKVNGDGVVTLPDGKVAATLMDVRSAPGEAGWTRITTDIHLEQDSCALRNKALSNNAGNKGNDIRHERQAMSIAMMTEMTMLMRMTAVVMVIVVPQGTVY